MRISIFILNIIFVINAFSQREIKNDSVIIWMDSRILTLQDFKAVPDSINYDFKVTSALSTIGIEYNMKQFKLNKINELSVIAVFYKNKSWIAKVDNNILLHEQIHFDIAEIYARKIRREFTILKQKNETDTQKYYDVYKKYYVEMNFNHKKHDDETINYYVRIKEKKDNTEYELVYEDDEDKGDMQLYSFGLERWQKKVANELKELEAYRCASTSQEIQD